MSTSLEREIIPRAKDFLIESCRRNIGPQLRTVYEAHVEALEKRVQSSLMEERKNAETPETVTTADISIDSQIRESWQNKFPDIPVLLEESKELRLEGMRPEQLREVPIVLVVDPIDGSGRLARGSDRFSTSFGLVMKGKPVLAVVYQPVTDTLWTAEKDQEGAFKNDKQIYVSDTNDLDKAIVSTAFAWNRQKRAQNQKIFNRWALFINKFVGTASSVLDGTDVAQGVTDAHVSIGLKPWDVAGFSLLVEKAGGKVTPLNGKGEWTPFQSDILASNGLIHNDLLDVINRNAMLAALMKLYRIQIRRDIRDKGVVYSAFDNARKAVTIFHKKNSSRT